MTTRLLGIAVLAFALLAGPSCDEDRICGPGTQPRDGQCVPLCAPGTEMDPETGHCVNVCMEGTYRDPETGGCLPLAAKCVSGEVFDYETEECVDVASMCSAGSTWVASEGACVLDELLREPDYQEGTGENNPWFGDDFEWFHAPEMGETVSIGGTVNEPYDKNGDGILDPDYDLWLFEVEEPMLLRINADGIGGATSGFYLISIEPDIGYLRFGAAHTATDLTRDVFLPHPGLYGLMMSDALNFLTDRIGPFHGGGDMGYYVEIERREIPEPIPLSLEDGMVFHESQWSLEVPDEGSMLHFYTVNVEPRSMYLFALGTTSFGSNAAEQLVVTGEDLLFGGDKGGAIQGFVHEKQLMLVADYVTNLSHGLVDYGLHVERWPMTWLDEPEHFTIDQPEWQRYHGELPFLWYGFEAEQSEIFTVHLDSSTGNTCIELYDAGFGWALDRVNCSVEAGLTMHEMELRMIAPYTGYYGLASLDWQGGAYDFEGVFHIPAHSYDLSARISRQLPEYLGHVSEISAAAELDETYLERFFLLRAAPGEAVTGTVSGEIEAEAAVYDAYFGMLTSLGPSEGETLAWRSFQGESALFGVRDATGEQGAFELDINPVTFHDLDPVSSEANHSESITLETGTGRVFPRLWLDTPGMATVQVIGDPRLSVTVRSLDLSRVQGPLPLPATIEKAGNEDGVFLEIATLDGFPLESEALVTIDASLAAAQPHQSSLGRSDSEILELPAAVAGTLQHMEDVHWVGVEVAKPSRLVATVLPRGQRGPGDTVMAIYDEAGQELALDFDSGPGAYSALDLLIEEPGTYYVGVVAVVFEPSDYLLEVRSELP